MMSRVIRLMFVVMMMVIVAPAFSTEVVQMWYCEMDDDASEQWVRDHIAEWLTAAKPMEGGDNIEAWVLFPVAVNAMDEFDLIVVVTAPSFQEWGKFWDGYEGSAASDVETRDDDMLNCPDSALWESTKVAVE